MSNYNNFHLDELVGLLSGPLASNHHVHNEILNRITPDFREFFNNMQDGYEKKALAEFIKIHPSDFDQCVDWGQVERILASLPDDTSSDQPSDSGGVDDENRVSITEDYDKQ
jgi:hypothetical protein